MATVFVNAVFRYTTTDSIARILTFNQYATFSFEYRKSLLLEAAIQIFT